MPARASAVAMYTLLELSRRRLLLLLLVLEGLLVAGIGIAPHVIQNASSGEESALTILATISGVASGGLLVCTIGIGMTVIRNDLDSGAIVAILAKPVSRLAYVGGKVAAAALLLVAMDALFGIATIGLVALNGGSTVASVPWFFAITAANALIWLVVVMVVTVYLNNVLGAVVTIGFLFLQGVFGELHTLIQAHVITARLWITLSETGYLLLPRPLASNLEREVSESSMRLHPGSRAAVPLSAIPGASSAGDVLVWLTYLILVCGLLYLALRRKQV
jgi:ABC-type transport system involved in multi-copper enzyme maturation permease subunit